MDILLFDVFVPNVVSCSEHIIMAKPGVLAESPSTNVLFCAIVGLRWIGARFRIQPEMSIQSHLKEIDNHGISQ